MSGKKVNLVKSLALEIFEVCAYWPLNDFFLLPQMFAQIKPKYNRKIQQSALIFCEKWNNEEILSFLKGSNKLSKINCSLCLMVRVRFLDTFCCGLMAWFLFSRVHVTYFDEMKKSQRLHTKGYSPISFHNILTFWEKKMYLCLDLRVSYSRTLFSANFYTSIGQD